MGAFREICSLGTCAGRCTPATALMSLCEQGLSHHLDKIYALSIRLVSSQRMMVLKYGLTLEDMVCEGPTRAIHICGYSRWQCNFRQQTSGTSGSTRLWESWSRNLMSRLRVGSGELLSQKLRLFLPVPLVPQQKHERRESNAPYRGCPAHSDGLSCLSLSPYRDSATSGLCA